MDDVERVLMHGDLPVARLSMREGVGIVDRALSVERPDHMPLGTMVRGRVDRRRLMEWWQDRSIPTGRPRVRELLDALGLAHPFQLPFMSMGLCLSDQYWIRPPESDVRWSDVDFFRNPFPGDVGDILLGKQWNGGDVDISTPDCTTEGNLTKRWAVVDGRRLLFKGGTRPFLQEPFNEVVASRVCEALGIGHVDYSVQWINGGPFSVCEDFVTPETELVTAYRAMLARQRRNDESLYTHCVRSCAELGVDVVPFLDRMIVLDHVIGNTDRHTNNFGLLRRADTLEFIGPAPMFDSGTSLGHDLRAEEIPELAGIGCKPFKKRSVEQLALVTSFDWIDFDALESCLPSLRDIMGSSNGLIDAERQDAILEFVRRRVSEVRLTAGRRRRHRYIPSSRPENGWMG